MRIDTDVEYQDVIVQLNSLANLDPAFMMYAHSRLAAYCEPYVPMREGILLSSVRVTPDYIEYATPYAHYMYEGEIYGPNIPIRSPQTGEIIGWFSPKGQPKHPTGRRMNYRHDLHPLASDHWDKAAMAEHMTDLTNDLAAYLTLRSGGDSNGE